MIYTPILTGKAGEFSALVETDAEVLNGLAPLIDMAPYDPSDTAKEPDHKLNGLLHSVTASWANGRKVTVDLTSYDDAPAIDGAHPLEWLVRRGVWHGAQLHLAVPTDCSDRYLRAVLASVGTAAGLCIRARVPPGADPTTTAMAINRCVESVGCPPSELDLLVDLGRLSDHSAERIPEFAELARDHLAAVPQLASWQTLTLGGTDVPRNDEITRRNPHRVMRREWRLWHRLRDDGLPRLPSYADYGVTGPRPLKPGGSAPAPNLRYTTDAALLIWKGRRPIDVQEGDEPPLTFPELCYELIHESDGYLGPEFSPGDRAYQEVLDPSHGRGPGGAREWVRWATSHHLRHVIERLASLP
ncbi:MAG: hypothetical protein QOD83_2510 [Solirubrobacteraceae bacterium]|nr:hypothetical protein [Solirubrobacteraceae bacterium]